jgi:ubiquinone/menaquinone biosynthesis C-methylase UbiE
MSSDIRWRISRELEESIYKKYIIGKHVLDIGTRSGENAIMMLNSMHAASVTAIDITSSEFPSETCGVTFVKSSIQEFAKNTDLTYDTVTVFLWNIPFVEYDSCMSAINKILKPNGNIIVGIADDVYVRQMDDVSIAKLFIINEYYNYTIYHSCKINKYLVYATQSIVSV